jgi:ATP-dependent Clp protease ATP-binding subunit ClpC
MFERYTERARRAVFFARYKASQHASANIEPEHLLLGLIRENFLLFGKQLHPSIAHVPRIRQEIEKRIERKRSILAPSKFHCRQSASAC